MKLVADLLNQILTVGLAVAAITYLAKRTIDHVFLRGVERHKADLQREVAESMSEFRAGLEKEQIRLQIAYGGIYEKQADAILELYKLLTQFERLMYVAAHPGDDSVSYTEFINVWESLMRAYDERQILLTESVDEKVGDIAKAIFTAVHDVRRVEDRIAKVGHALSQEQFDRLYRNQDEAYEILNRIPDVKKELKGQMRQLLGVHYTQEQAVRET